MGKFVVLFSSMVNDPAPGSCLLPFPPPPRETWGTRVKLGTSAFPALPICPHCLTPVPGRTLQFLQCPGEPPTPPALTLDRRHLPPVHPWTPTCTQEEQRCHSSTRRKDLGMAAGTTGCASASSFMPECSPWPRDHIPWSEPLSQSAHIGDSFPSHVPGTEILSGGGGHVTPFLSSPPVLHDELLICYDLINAGTQTSEF